MLESNQILLEASGDINFREITFQNFISEKERKENENYYKGGCCNCCQLGIIGNIIFVFIICMFCIGLSIGSKITVYNNNKEYSDLRQLILIQMKLNTTENYVLKFLPFNHKQFFCNIVYWEDPFLLSQIIMFIIYLIFLIMLIFAYYSLFKIQNKDGIIYKLCINLNYIFHYAIKLHFVFSAQLWHGR